VPASTNEICLREALAPFGLCALARFEPARFDALVPPHWRASAVLARAGDARGGAARDVALIGSGGRALFDAFRTSREARGPGPDPLDRFVRRGLDAARAALLSRGVELAVVHYDDLASDGSGAPSFLDLLALARAAGIGFPSPLGLLVHREFGPWWSLRALAIASEPLALGPRPSARASEVGRALAPSPCADCAAPCASACPARAVQPGRVFAVDACSAWRSEQSVCESTCAARRACPVGREHAYDPDAEAHHMRASARFLAVAAGAARERSRGR